MNWTFFCFWQGITGAMSLCIYAPIHKSTIHATYIHTLQCPLDLMIPKPAHGCCRKPQCREKNLTLLSNFNLNLGTSMCSHKFKLSWQNRTCKQNLQVATWLAKTCIGQCCFTADSTEHWHEELSNTVGLQDVTEKMDDFKHSFGNQVRTIKTEAYVTTCLRLICDYGCRAFIKYHFKQLPVSERRQWSIIVWIRLWLDVTCDEL